MAAAFRAATLLALLLCARFTPGVEAQSFASAAGAVVDVTTGDPVSDALLRLERVDAPGAWQQYTDTRGAFRFATLPAGRYQLRAERAGYRAFDVAFELSAAQPLLLSVALVVEPVPLAPLRLRATRQLPFERPRSSTPPAVAPAGGAFPHLTLSTDSRQLTGDDVVNAITLAGPDVFRALQRQPGVSTRSGYTAELWLRGAPWHETRVQFDGVPLHGPLHALGTVSALPTASVGALRLEPGVRAPGIGDAASGSVLIDTRSAEGSGTLNGLLDLSLLSAALTLDQRVADGRAGWLVSARRSHIDWLTAAVADEIPYHFWDVTTRADANISAHTQLDASALLQQDRLSGVRRADAAWGAQAARVTLSHTGAALATRHTLAFSRSLLEVSDTIATTSMFDSLLLVPASASGSIRYAALTGEWRPAEQQHRLPAWAAGYGLSLQRVHFEGLPPLPVPRNSSVVPVEEELLDGEFLSTGTYHMATLWGERTLQSEIAALQLGVRVEAGARIADAPAVRASPRVSARLRAHPQLTLSAALGRTYQYVQALAPTGVHMASLSAADVWVVAGADVPPLRADAATLGVHAVWPARRLQASAHAFVRHTDGAVMPPPAPGPLHARPLYVIGRGEARGVEVEVRRVGAPLEATAAYTFTHARLRAQGLHFTAPSERPHQLDVTLAWQAHRSVRAGVALSAASGTPYTVITPPCLGECAPEQPAPWSGFPNASRAPASQSLDLQLVWEQPFGRTRVQAYAQLHNALNRDNGTFYTSTRAGCYANYCGARAFAETRYERGLPRLPIIGVNLAF